MLSKDGVGSGVAGAAVTVVAAGGSAVTVDARVIPPIFSARVESGLVLAATNDAANFIKSNPAASGPVPVPAACAVGGSGGRLTGLAASETVGDAAVTGVAVAAAVVAGTAAVVETGEGVAGVGEMTGSTASESEKVIGTYR